jgi:hypothetical protein
MNPLPEQECLGVAFHNRRLKVARFSHSGFSASHLRADAADDTAGKTSRSFELPFLWLISLGADLPADDLPKRADHANRLKSRMQKNCGSRSFAAKAEPLMEVPTDLPDADSLTSKHILRLGQCSLLKVAAADSGR